MASSTKGKRVFVVGVGMTKFEKPGRRDWDYPDMGKIAISRALADAGIPYEAVEQACVGYVYGDSTCGQRALYEVGITGIPVYNVNNNCATGSTALYMARQFILGGLNECVLAFGFEKMERGSLKNKYQDRTNPLDKHVTVMLETDGMSKAPFAPQMFGNAGREHMRKYGTKLEHFAKIAEKNHRHSQHNPYSQFRKVYSLDQIVKSRKVHDPLTMLQCCPTSDGAGAAILCTEAFVHKYGLQKQAVEILGMAMATDFPSTFEEKSMIKVVGFDMTKSAAQSVYKQAGVGPEGVQVVELHDCFSCNELLTYEALGLCGVGEAAKLIDAGDNTYGGKWVVNPSGGLISKGHPLGATGLAQCAELCWQIRGQAGKRQVKGAKRALQHNLGLGGAAVVAMYGMGKFEEGSALAVNKGESKSSSVGKPSAGEEVPNDEFTQAAQGSSGASSGGGAGGVEAFFAQMGSQITPAIIKKVGCVYRFTITLKSTGKATSWLVNLKNAPGGVTKDGSGKADCTIIMGEADFLALMAGKLNPQSAFMKGKLKLKGNMMLAQKLSVLMEEAKKGGAKPSGGGASSNDSGLAAEKVFAELKSRMSADIVKKVKGTYRFDITGANGVSKSWFVNLKSGSGSMSNEKKKADCIIAMKDADFVALMAGKLNAQKAFMQGKIKLKGNLMLAQKLQVLQKAKAKL